MASHSIRLSSMLSFDEEQEKDIIQVVEALNSSHKIGQFISMLIRLGMDNPEILECKDGKYVEGTIAKQIEASGMTYNRQAFMKSITKDVNDMKQKVDKIYEMVLRTYTLGLMGKHLGLEQKAENDLLANFILQKQLKDLQDSLGIQLTSSIFASNKVHDTKKLAEDVMEYIIESYDSIILQLKELTTVQTTVQQVVVSNIPTENINKPIENNSIEVKKQEVVNNISSNDEVDEIIDFGEADLTLLGNFFGDS